MNPAHSSRGFFAFAMTFEGGILLVALLLGRWTDAEVLPTLAGGWRDPVGGALAALPMFLVMVWMVESRNPLWQNVRHVVEQLVLPSLRPLRLWQLAALSLVAGIGEEALFRGLLQTKLAAHLDKPIGLMLASIAFGLAHALTPGYALLATGMGLWLGGLCLWTGGLMAPAVCHAVYDFGVLLYLLRLHVVEPVQTSSSDNLR